MPITPSGRELRPSCNFSSGGSPTPSIASIEGETGAIAHAKRVKRCERRQMTKEDELFKEPMEFLADHDRALYKEYILNKNQGYYNSKNEKNHKNAANIYRKLSVFCVYRNRKDASINDFIGKENANNREKYIRMKDKKKATRAQRQANTIYVRMRRLAKTAQNNDPSIIKIDPKATLEEVKHFTTQRKIKLLSFRNEVTKEFSLFSCLKNRKSISRLSVAQDLTNNAMRLDLNDEQQRWFAYEALRYIQALQEELQGQKIQGSDVLKEDIAELGEEIALVGPSPVLEILKSNIDRTCN